MYANALSVVLSLFDVTPTGRRELFTSPEELDQVPDVDLEDLDLVALFAWAAID